MMHLTFYIIIVHHHYHFHFKCYHMCASAICVLPRHHTFVVKHHYPHHSWHVQPYTLSSFMMYSTFYSSSFIIIITFMLSAITCVHQHFILGQCVFNVTPLYLCCHTSCLGLQHCHHHSWHVQPSTSLSFTTCYHRSWSLSLSSQVSSYASALYQHQGAEQSPRWHPFQAL